MFKSVKRKLDLHSALVVILLITPIITLNWVISESKKTAEDSHQIYSNLLIKLSEIDGSIKNARFHALAGFMHDKSLSVSSYHKHPLDIHFTAMDTEFSSADKNWSSILENLPKNKSYSKRVIELKNQFDQFMKSGGLPIKNALEKEDWEGIVKYNTTSIAQYSTFSKNIKELIIDVKDIAQNEYTSMLEKLQNLQYALIIINVIFVAVYLIFSTWLKKLITTPLTESMKVAGKIAAGDLTPNTLRNREDEFGQLESAIEGMRQNLSKMIERIKETSESVDSLSKELEHSSNKTSKSISEQMHSLTQSSSVLEQVLVSIDDIANNSNETSLKAEETKLASSSGMTQIKNTTNGIDEMVVSLEKTSTQVESLSSQLKEIFSVTDVIQNVAEQTNLLALNAAIEASRAGEHGRGFAVVADEVRSLAETTKSSAEKISSSILDIQKNALSTVTSMNDSSRKSVALVENINVAHQSMNTIESATTLVKESISGIARALDEQRIASNQLAVSVEELAHQSTINSDEASRVAKMAVELRTTSEKLGNASSGFLL